MRPAAAVLALGLTLAVGAPTAWALTQPPAAAGAPVEQVLANPPAPAAPPAPAPPPARVTVRDAAPSPAPAVPAPVRLEVPALGVDAPLDQAGVTADGQMALPDDVTRAAWYRFGPVPGEPGSAVLAGHVDDAEQGLGELAPLSSAEPGHEVVVTDAAGATTRWRVVSRDVVHKQALPLDLLFSRDGAPRLTLVTCGGPFLPDVGGYRDNVVVVAEPAR